MGNVRERRIDFLKDFSDEQVEAILKEELDQSEHGDKDHEKMVSIGEAIYETRNLAAVRQKENNAMLDKLIASHPLPPGQQDVTYAQWQAALDEVERSKQKKEAKKRSALKKYPEKGRTRLLDLAKVTNMTRNGRQRSFRALVVVGNGKGAAGFGISTDAMIKTAIVKANRSAQRDRVAVEVNEEGSIHHDVEGKFNGIRIRLKAMPGGSGLTCHHVVRSICECVGISAVSGKVLGTASTMSIVMATFDALGKVKSPAEMGQAVGRRMIKVDKGRVSWQFDI